MTSEGQNERTERVVVAHWFWGRRKKDIDLTLKIIVSAIGILLFVGSCTAGVAALLGISLTGTPAAVMQVQEELTDLKTQGGRGFAALRAGQLVGQDSIRALGERVRQVEEAIILLAYTQCVQLRRDDPDLLPPACQQTIARVRKTP